MERPSEGVRVAGRGATESTNEPQGTRASPTVAPQHPTETDSGMSGTRMRATHDYGAIPTSEHEASGTYSPTQHHHPDDPDDHHGDSNGVNGSAPGETQSGSNWHLLGLLIFVIIVAILVMVGLEDHAFTAFLTWAEGHKILVRIGVPRSCL